MSEDKNEPTDQEALLQELETYSQQMLLNRCYYALMKKFHDGEVVLGLEEVLLDPDMGAVSIQLNPKELQIELKTFTEEQVMAQFESQGKAQQ